MLGKQFIFSDLNESCNKLVAHEPTNQCWCSHGFSFFWCKMLVTIELKRTIRGFSKRGSVGSNRKKPVARDQAV